MKKTIHKEETTLYTHEQKKILDEFIKILKRIGVIENDLQVDMSAQYEVPDTDVSKWPYVDSNKLLFTVTVSHSISIDHLTIIKEICGYDIAHITPMKNGEMEVYFLPNKIVDENHADWVREYKDRFFEGAGNPKYSYVDEVGHETSITLSKDVSKRLRHLCTVDDTYDTLLMKMMNAYENLTKVMGMLKELKKKMNAYEAKKVSMNRMAYEAREVLKSVKAYQAKKVLKNRKKANAATYKLF